MEMLSIKSLKLVSMNEEQEGKRKLGKCGSNTEEDPDMGKTSRIE
jgi:hypothetical protein